MPHFEWAINLSDVALIGGGIFAFFKMFLTQRDLNREVLHILKGRDGKNGLIGDVKLITHDMYISGGKLSRLTHWIEKLRRSLASQKIDTPDQE